MSQWRTERAISSPSDFGASILQCWLSREAAHSAIINGPPVKTANPTPLTLSNFCFLLPSAAPPALNTMSSMPRRVTVERLGKDTGLTISTATPPQTTGHEKAPASPGSARSFGSQEGTSYIPVSAAACYFFPLLLSSIARHEVCSTHSSESCRTESWTDFCWCLWLAAALPSCGRDVEDWQDGVRELGWVLLSCDAQQLHLAPLRLPFYQGYSHPVLFLRDAMFCS